MRKSYPWIPFGEALQDVSAGNRKIPQSAFARSGSLAVVDQGQALVAGYTDDHDAAVNAEPPVIVFGDHTRALKFVDFPFAMGADGIKVLRVRRGFDPRYVFHFLSSRPIRSAGYSRHFKFLKEIKVPGPPLAEQRRIAAVLDQAERLRSQRGQVAGHLDRLVGSIFDRTFGDSDLPQDRLETLATFYSGGTPSKGSEDYWIGELPWFSAKDLKASDLYDSIDHVSSRVPSETGIRLLPEGTIVMVVRGMILAHTVPVSVLRVPATINQDLKAVLPHAAVDGEYLAAAIRHRARWILSRVSTAAHGTKKLEQAALGSIPIPRASPQQQRAFVAKAHAVEQVHATAVAASKAADEMFASLRAQAFSGEL